MSGNRADPGKEAPIRGAHRRELGCRATCERIKACVSHLHCPYCPMQTTVTEYLDISIPVSSDILVYPGDSGPTISAIQSGVDGHLWNTGVYEGGLHIGTHLDAPWHRVPGGKRL